MQEARSTPRSRTRHFRVGCALAVVGVVVVCVIAGVSGPALAAEDPTARPRGDVSARSFAEYCRGELPAERRARFDRRLDDAEVALDRGDLEMTETALSEALSAVYRGGAESAVSVKCLGGAPARRWLDTRLELDRQQVARGGRDRTASEAELRVVAIDRGRDALVERVRELEPRRFANACFALEGIADRIDAERRFGAFLLPKEEMLLRVAREAMTRLRPIAAEGRREALAREARIFDGRETETERQSADAVRQASALAEAFVGPEAGLPTDEATVVLQGRSRRSLEALNEARAWNLDRSTPRSETPESARAAARADTLMARASEATASLALQEAGYRAAERYYDFAERDDRAKAARERRDALEPALRAAREKRDRALDEAAERMDLDPEAIRRSAQDMMKDEAEKKAFEEEADALEDELGF